MSDLHALTTKILAQLSLKGDTIVAPEYRKRAIITMYDLIYAVVSNPVSTEIAAISINTSKTYILAYLKTHISTKPTRDRWSNWLLYSISYKYCCSCCSYLPLDSFANNLTHIKASACKACTSEYKDTYLSGIGKEKARDYYQSNKESIVTKTISYREEHLEQYKKYQTEYYTKNKESGIFNEYAARRRARKLHATPSWANLDIIKLIYANAEGAHVDHIIPLQGQLVCGLHIESNLQYLTPEENLKKSNKFEIASEI